MKRLDIKRKQLFLGLVGVLSCVTFIVMASLSTPTWGQLPAQNAPIETLRQQQKQVKQQKQQVVRERDRITNLQDAAQTRLNGLQQNLQTTENHIQDSETRLQQATTRLQQLQADLAVAESSYAARQNATVARLRFLQRSPTSFGWAVLLQSRSISDFLNRRQHLKQVYQADQKILQVLTIEANQLIQQKTDVEQVKNEIDLIRQQLLAQKSDYQTQARFQQESVQRLNSDRIALTAAENQLEQDSQSLTSLIQQKIAISQAREAAAKALGKKFTSGTGIFGFPSDATISSSFGWRMHPILGYRRFHSGIDFAGNYGSVIRAADSGTVIFAGWYGGYGRAVIIDHGKGITTLYGHTSELFVTEGQSVQRGQQIAAVGSSGLSTGPHLHFEVRRDGTPIDPAGFL
jgi:murein DD-endopeptidase MepM/ murein hydrolase activator NlpD